MNASDKHHHLRETVEKANDRKSK